MKLEADHGGTGPRLLVLLHGLGATREVWQPMLATPDSHWDGSWIAPDLRGHGRSAYAKTYALGQHAADVAELVLSAGVWSEVVVVGHSMGGAIALALASGWFGIMPAYVFGLGIKVAWTPEEIFQLGNMAAAPARIFESRDSAIARYLKVSGLTGLVTPVSIAAMAGIREIDHGWRLAADPAAASVGAPPMRAMTAAAQASIHLARGAADTIVTHDQLFAFDPSTTDLAGLGHNAMVQNPEAVWQWLRECLA
jgi:pimeloyl-ACP methyl ester carboxylesterase